MRIFLLFNPNTRDVQNTADINDSRLKLSVKFSSDWNNFGTIGLLEHNQN